MRLTKVHLVPPVARVFGVHPDETLLVVRTTDRGLVVRLPEGDKASIAASDMIEHRAEGCPVCHAAPLVVREDLSDHARRLAAEQRRERARRVSQPKAEVRRLDADEAYAFCLEQIHEHRVPYATAAARYARQTGWSRARIDQAVRERAAHYDAAELLGL